MLGATTATAQEKSDDEWKTDLSVYLWGATLQGTTVTDDDFLINFGTILSNLNFAAMATFNARKNKFSILTDVIYLDISDKFPKQGEFLGQPIDGTVKLGVKAPVINLIAGYNLIDNGKTQFDIVAGGRYIDVDLPITITIGDKKKKTTTGGNSLDGVIGFKGRSELSEGTYLTYYGDVGAGDSKITYQAAAAWGYEFKRWDGVIGYRYLRWEMKDGDANALNRLFLHGPYIAAKWHF